MTSAPAAGWYTDPSNPGQERWWGGVEWTHDVRPLAAPAPVVAPSLMTQPVVADVPGGGINPFAEIDAQERMLAVGSYDFSAPAAASPVSTIGSYGSYGSGSITTQPGVAAVDSGWYDPNRLVAPREEPKNAVATVGLILGLLGFNLIAIVVSAIGLRKARAFELDGDLPVGRTRSRWGIALGIITLLTMVALTVSYLFFYQAIVSYFTQLSGMAGQSQQQQGGLIDDLGLPEVTTGDIANDGTYERAAYEQAIFAEYAADEYPTPDSVTCPDEGSTAAGSVVICTIVTGDLSETRTTQYFDGGYQSTTMPTT